MRPRSILLLALTLAAPILVGCKSTLMKTPAAVSIGGVDPFFAVMPRWRNNQAPVFVASARTVSGRAEPHRFYTNERSREVRLGVATVEIGPGMTWEELAAESLLAKRRNDPELRVVEYREFGPLWATTWPADYRFTPHWEAPGADRAPANEFVAAIEDVLNDSRRKEITIYVHGFNTRFVGNLEITGEFWHYMTRDGVVMSFDWPSKGDLFSYQVDKANAEFAVRQFRRLLEFLAENTSAERINIIAHSAGNPIVVEALRQLSLMHYDLPDAEARKRTRIGRVVLAAPDMDLDAAVSAGIDGSGRVTQGMAVYASSVDKALSFSGSIFGDVRLGRSIGKLTDEERDALIANKGQWIDATNAQRRASSFLGHSYYHQNPWVSSDVMLFLRLGAPPEDRGLVRDLKTGFLAFPDDYEKQLPDIVKRLQAAYAHQAAPPVPNKPAAE